MRTRSTRYILFFGILTALLSGVLFACGGKSDPSQKPEPPAGPAVRYVVNLDGVESTPIPETRGETVTIADGALFAVRGYYFVGWNTSPTGTVRFSDGKADGQYNAGEQVALVGDMTLYAQWARGYTDKAGGTDTVYIYEPLIAQGLGAAHLVRAGTADKAGFAVIDEEHDCLEFTFMYDEGDIAGRIYGDGFVYRDRYYGNFTMYDYITRSPAAYFLATDGYGNATLSSLVGNLTHTLTAGKYTYDAQYDDYLFLSVDALTQAETHAYDFHYVLSPSSATEGSAGYFMWQGSESGSYLRYENGQVYSERLDLYGYGNARRYEYDAAADDLTLADSGAYYGTAGYESAAGEWHYAPESGDAFDFVLTSIGGETDDATAVFIVYDASKEATYTHGEDRLEIDGYGTAVYTAGGERYFGYCVLTADAVTMTAMRDGAFGAESAGMLLFDIDRAAKTFALNTTGCVVDDGVLVSYLGTSRVIRVPDGVTVIADDVCNYTKINLSVTAVTIPDGVTTIGARAFQNNYTLHRVTFLSATPIDIDWDPAVDPFRWGAGDMTIVVPEGSQDAYKAAWTNCPYTIKGAEEVTRLDEFEIDGGVLVRYNRPADAPDMLDPIIPDGVTEIAAYVFRGMDDIRSIDLHNVTHIGAGAFENCTSLERVTGGAVTHIGEGAFFGCVSLVTTAAGEETLSFPAAVLVGANAFQGCESLRRVVFGANLTEIGGFAFAECQIYEDDPPLFIELTGTQVPTPGEKVAVGNIAVRIQIPSISVAKQCFASPAWNSYIRHLYIPSGGEKGLYMDGDATLMLDGRAVILGSGVCLYSVSGIAITLYVYDEETATVTEIPGSYDGSQIALTIGGRAYTFKKVREGATYTSEDGKYTLVVADPKQLDPEAYGGAIGYADVTFGGVATKLEIRGYNSKIIREFRDTDGAYYDFAITLSGDTFTYTKTRSATIRDIAAADGSVLNIHYVGAYVYVYGTLRIDRGDGQYLTFSDNSVLATAGENGTYTFSVRYQEKTFAVTAVIDTAAKTFSYTYTE